LVSSLGQCEICGELSDCNEVKSADLPKPSGKSPEDWAREVEFRWAHRKPFSNRRDSEEQFRRRILTEVIEEAMEEARRDSDHSSSKR
jgi:hypothetical protein